MASPVDLTVRTLTDGGQEPLGVANEIASFLGAARRSLDLAQYDFHLVQATAAVVGGALTDARARGVRVRILYNVDHGNPVPVPPPPEPDAQLIASLGVESRAVAGIPDLMHHKYVIRDDEWVLTGSTNWTDDSWSRQENVILLARSPELAAAFSRNFAELWDGKAVEDTGRVDAPPIDVGGVEGRAWFTPGHGEDLAYRLGRAIGRARRRVRICSPVLTSAPVLSAVAEAVSERRVDFAACVDRTQVEQVIDQWHQNGNAAWKLPLLQRALGGQVSAKLSTPWSPTAVHDYMHAKVVVADETVFVGSFNLSRSGEKNAENVVEFRHPGLADDLARYVDDVRARYPPWATGQSR